MGGQDNACMADTMCFGASLSQSVTVTVGWSISLTNARLERMLHCVAVIALQTVCLHTALYY